MGNSNEQNLIVLTTDIVSAYVQKNVLQVNALPELIGTVHASLKRLDIKIEEVAETKQTPAVSVRKSIKPDAITCLECGLHFKSLKRHLSSNHDLTSVEYREKWSLAPDYPMVAPAYSETRSALAKAMGLGQQRKASRAKKKAA